MAARREGVGEGCRRSSVPRGGGLDHQQGVPFLHLNPILGEYLHHSHAPRTRCFYVETRLVRLDHRDVPLVHHLPHLARDLHDVPHDAVGGC